MPGQHFRNVNLDIRQYRSLEWKFMLKPDRTATYRIMN